MIKVGDTVRPKVEWRDDSNRVPSGRILAIAACGKDGAYYVEGDHRAFAAYVFDVLMPDQMELNLP